MLVPLLVGVDRGDKPALTRGCFHFAVLHAGPFQGVPIRRLTGPLASDPSRIDAKLPAPALRRILRPLLLFGDGQDLVIEALAKRMVSQVVGETAAGYGPAEKHAGRFAGLEEEVRER